MKLQKTISAASIISILSIGLVSTSVFALIMPQLPSEGVSTGNDAVKTSYMPEPQVVYEYKYDKELLKKLTDNKKSNLYKIVCSKTDILKSMGFNNNDIFSFGMKKDNIEWNYDLNNCSMYGRNTLFTNYEGKTLTEKEALEIADTFYKKHIANNKSLYSVVGKPIVKYNANYYPMVKTAYSKNEVTQDINDNIEIDKDNVDDIKKEYSNFTVTYPFLIGNSEVYGSYGNMYGIDLNVYKDGVESVNIPLIKFRLSKKTSDLMSFEDITKLVNNGANVPFYGNSVANEKNIVNLSSIKRVYIVNSLFANNKNENYLSTGFDLFSDEIVNNWTNDKYKQIISDYKIVNNSY